MSARLDATIRGSWIKRVEPEFNLFALAVERAEEPGLYRVTFGLNVVQLKAASDDLPLMPEGISYRVMSVPKQAAVSRMSSEERTAHLADNSAWAPHRAPEPPATQTPVISKRLSSFTARIEPGASETFFVKLEQGNARVVATMLGAP